MLEIIYKLFIKGDVLIPGGTAITAFSFYVFPKLDKAERWVPLILLTYILTEIAASYFALHGWHNLWIYNVMLIPESALLAIVFSGKLNTGKQRYLLLFLVCALLLIHSSNMLFYQGWNEFNNYTYIPIIVLQAVFSFLYLRSTMMDLNTKPFDHLVSWLAIATLIDAAGSIPILTTLAWHDFLNSGYSDLLSELVMYLFYGWFLIIGAGILWTKTSLRSRFSSR